MCFWGQNRVSKQKKSPSHFKLHATGQFGKRTVARPILGLQSSNLHQNDENKIPDQFLRSKTGLETKNPAVRFSWLLLHFQRSSHQFVTIPHDLSSIPQNLTSIWQDLTRSLQICHQFQVSRIFQIFLDFSRFFHLADINVQKVNLKSVTKELFAKSILARN